jgi:hypothetical protein
MQAREAVMDAVNAATAQNALNSKDHTKRKRMELPVC